MPASVVRGYSYMSAPGSKWYSVIASTSSHPRCSAPSQFTMFSSCSRHICPILFTNVSPFPVAIDYKRLDVPLGAMFPVPFTKTRTVSPLELVELFRCQLGCCCYSLIFSSPNTSNPSNIARNFEKVLHEIDEVADLGQRSGLSRDTAPGICQTASTCKAALVRGVDSRGGKLRLRE